MLICSLFSDSVVRLIALCAFFLHNNSKEKFFQNTRTKTVLFTLSVLVKLLGNNTIVSILELYTLVEQLTFKRWEKNNQIQPLILYISTVHCQFRACMITKHKTNHLLRYLPWINYSTNCLDFYFILHACIDICIIDHNARFL